MVLRVFNRFKKYCTFIKFVYSRYIYFYIVSTPPTLEH